MNTGTGINIAIFSLLKINQLSAFLEELPVFSLEALGMNSSLKYSMN
jgi:hypothetical protein